MQVVIAYTVYTSILTNKLLAYYKQIWYIPENKRENILIEIQYKRILNKS